MFSATDSLSRSAIPRSDERLTSMSEPIDEPLICEDCKKAKTSVRETICPYNQDINNKEIPATLCAECYSNRVADI